MTYDKYKEYTPIEQIPMRLGPSIIGIGYIGVGFHGQLILCLDEFFPATTTNLKRLMIICQMGVLPEIRYLIEMYEWLLDHERVHPSLSEQKRYNNNLKMLKERIDKLGGREQR